MRAGETSARQGQVGRGVPLPKKELRVRFGLAEAGDAVAGFPLAALFKDFDALEALHNVAFCASGAGGPETAML